MDITIKRNNNPKIKIMSIIVCKIFTPEFEEKFNKQVEIEVEMSIAKKIALGDYTIDDFRLKTLRSMERLRIKDTYYFMWNNSENQSYHIPIEYEIEGGHTEVTSIKEEYNKVGLWQPIYTTVELENKAVGLQSRPRVLWNNKITKVDDIDSVFSYERKQLKNIEKFENEVPNDFEFYDKFKEDDWIFVTAEKLNVNSSEKYVTILAKFFVIIDNNKTEFIFEYFFNKDGLVNVINNITKTEVMGYPYMDLKQFENYFIKQNQ